MVETLEGMPGAVSRENPKPSDVVRQAVRTAREGQPRSLSATQERQLYRWLNGRDPKQPELDFGLWTRAVVIGSIEQAFGIQIEQPAAVQLVSQLGLDSAFEGQTWFNVVWMLMTPPAPPPAQRPATDEHPDVPFSVKPSRVIRLIDTSPPPRPLCYDNDEDWKTELKLAHTAGIVITRRKDTGKYAGNRLVELVFRDDFDFCENCTYKHKAAMERANRCFPSAAELARELEPADFITPDHEGD